MYESFYGLKEKPFNLLPDPDYIFMSQGHDNAYTHLEYAIAENKGFTIITGEIGSGKTTLINFLLSKIRQNIQVGLINNTSVSHAEFIKMICQEFLLTVKGMDKADMLDCFHNFLLRQYAERKRVILIIDEAQNLTPEVVEELRMLSNLEAEKHHLIQMILVGQPELKYKFQGKGLDQFVQRITVHCHIDGLSSDETDQYIRYRLEIGGAKNPNIFNKDAIGAVYRYSRGIPRLINILCDTALVYGYADGLKSIDRKIIDNIIRARAAGGIFSRKPQAKETAPSLPPLDRGISDQMEKRLDILAGRIQLLETILGRFDQRLSRLENTRDERDTIVIELFKMLKDSMESRAETLSQLYRRKEKTEVEPPNADENETGPPLTLFSRLKKKKDSPS